MRVDVINQFRRILAHLKEVSFLGSPGNRTPAVRTLPVYQLGFCPERFTGRTVPTLILAFIDIPFFIHFAEHLLNLSDMILVRRTNKLIIRGIHQIPDAVDFSGHIIHVLFGCTALFFRLGLNFHSVFICTGLKKDIVSLHSAEPGNAVRQNNFISISDMRLA